MCDRIVVMEKGCVCEEGTHDELMSRGGLYAGLYASQGMSLSVVGDVDGIGKSVVRESIEEEEKKEKEDDSIPDEVSESDMKNVNIVSLLKKTHTATLFFWLGFIGTAIRVVFPPLYSYAASILQGVIYNLGILANP